MIQAGALPRGFSARTNLFFPVEPLFDIGRPILSPALVALMICLLRIDYPLNKQSYYTAIGSSIALTQEKALIFVNGTSKLLVRSLGCHLLSDTAQGFRSKPHIRSDHVLGNALDDIWIQGKKIGVTLLSW